MRVVALKVGFFGVLRQVGDEFEAPDGAKASWFAPAASIAVADKPTRTAKPKAAPDEADLA